MAHLAFTNPLPWWGVTLVCGALAVVAWLAYLRSAVPRPRRDALIALRFVTLAALAIFLMRPVRVSDDGRRNVYVPILVDASRSMSIADADGQRRIDRARDLITGELLPALAGQFHVEVLSFGIGFARPVLMIWRRRIDRAICLERSRRCGTVTAAGRWPESFSSLTAAIPARYRCRWRHPTDIRDRRRVEDRWTRS